MDRRFDSRAGFLPIPLYIFRLHRFARIYPRVVLEIVASGGSEGQEGAIHTHDIIQIISRASTPRGTKCPSSRDVFLLLFDFLIDHFSSTSSSSLRLSFQVLAAVNV